MTSFPVLSGAVLAVSILVAIRSMSLASPKRTSHGNGEYFGMTPQQDEHEMKLVSADTEKMIFLEKLGSKCEPDDWNGVCAPPYHYHTSQYEDFEVLNGPMLFKVDGEILTQNKGEKVSVPPMAKHTLVKHGNEDVLARVTLYPNPTGEGQRFFPNLFGNLRDTNGHPNPLQVLYIFCNDGVRLADVPASIHQAICLVTNTIAPLFGCRLQFDEYPYQ